MLIGVKISSKEPDEQHPYGHERYECVAALLLSGILAAVGGMIGIGAIALIGRYVPQINWRTAWPVILIVIGIILIIPKNKKS